MRAQRVIGHHGLGHQFRLLGLDALVHMLAVVAVGPAVKRAVFDGCQVVGHQVAADFISLIHHRPQRAGLGRPAHAVGVAQAAGKNAVRAALGVNFPDGGTASLGRHAVFRHVAVGADRDIELAAIRTGNDVFRPVMVDGAARQVHHLDRRGANGGFATLVGKAHQRIRIGHVQLVTHQRHAKG